MKKSSKSKASTPRVDPYLEGLVGKLIDRLVGLEKKVDKILTQTAVRSSGGSSPVLASFPPPARRDRTMYEAVCADCSKVCEVPFKPTEDRPVYCKDCWARRKSGAAKGMHGMPVLTPVALPPKPASKLNVPIPAFLRPSGKPKKAKKKPPTKKKKK